jgi:serine/threonine protein kinase
MSDSRYRITERIAAGGMAEVFKGVAESIQGFRKNVAIKRVLPALTKNKKFVAMFLDEARLSLHLQHANIVQVFDIGHADETYFIVMEYVDGVDLKQLLEWRRRTSRLLTIGQTVYIIMEVCKGLAYAHDAVHPETGRPLGIVHRDVSPPNVLLSRNGEVEVTDFGLAKAAVQVETTDPGVVKGKMSYLSPEAARGEEVDRRADIFAVGILLYEMLTGKRLFYGESDYQTVELVRAVRIPPIATQNPEVEPELEEIVRKSLARRPDDRFQIATDLQDALAQYLFSRGLKMIQRDIAELVRGCLEDQAAASGAARRPRTNIIDTLLQDEILSFTSVDFQDGQEDGQEHGQESGREGGQPGGRERSQAGGRDSRQGEEAGNRAPRTSSQGRGVADQGGVRSPEGRERGERGSMAPMPPAHSGEYVDTRNWAEDSEWSGHRGAPAAGAPAAANEPDPKSGMTRGMTSGTEVAYPLEGAGSGRRFSKGLIIGVLVTAFVIGAAFAAWLVRG